MAKVTPMMEQYNKLKNEHPDSILFFRLGDFYEMFYDDAQIASRVLGITLTSRSKSSEEKVPMAGVPYHAAEGYIAKLIQKGHRVAICEQVEDPKKAKGIVDRKVVRIISPGTVMEEEMLQSHENNFFLTIATGSEKWGLAYTDISTGEVSVTEIPYENISTLSGEIGRLKPRELYASANLLENRTFKETIQNQDKILTKPFENNFTYPQARQFLLQEFSVHNLEGFELEGREAAVLAVAHLANYLLESQRRSLEFLINIRFYHLENFMTLDTHTRRNLELNQAMFNKSPRGSLAAILDKTKTAMGSRLIKKWINQPLLHLETINARLDLIQELLENDEARESIAAILDRIYDLERLIGRVCYGTANARDLSALKTSLQSLPLIEKKLANLKGKEYLLRKNVFDSLQDIFDLLNRALAPSPPITLTEGGIIKSGYSPDLDRLRNISVEGKDWIASLEKKEREKTGIKSLKIGYNKVFGYYLEVTRANQHLVPDYFVRKQTLANAERYFTPELKEKENQILNAEENINSLEYELFVDLRDKVKAESHRINSQTEILAELDTLISLAEAAREYNYCRPLLKDNKVIEIKGGRHPVVETTVENAFVPNDTFMDSIKSRYHIITGPNMSGKSTYLRQVALIVLMAQIGSFVPAEKAFIGIVDRIFTRVGATDDLTRGKSTFLVEMNEVAQIINNATPRSLILLDEVGRGTSTYDGLSIAWAVTEYINNPDRIGARTLFATHYHELTALEDRPGIQNFNVLVEKKGEEVIFLHIIAPGSSDESYGIYVAGLAGLPPEILYRAREILNSIEKDNKEIKPPPRKVPLFPDDSKDRAEKILKKIKVVDVMNISPLEAINNLYEIQQEIKKYFSKDGKNG